MTEFADIFDAGSPRPAPEALDKVQEDVISTLTATSTSDPDTFQNWTSRPDILLWCQRVSAASLGRIDDGWASRVLSDSPTVAALLSSEARRREFASSDGEPLTHAEAEFVRESVTDTIEPAFRQALRDVSRWAGEYNEDGGQPPDPTSQRKLAMRPVLDHAVEQHEAVLEDAIAGFNSRREIRRWSKRVIRVTDGIMDDTFSRTARYSPLWHGALTGGEETLETRVQLLATRVFPYLNAAVRLVASEAGEAQDAETEKTTVPTG